MNLLLIVGIIIIILLVLALIFNFIKLALKTVGLIILIVLAIFVVFGVLTYFDATDFQETFGTSNNLYLLRDNEIVLAGFVMNNSQPEKVVFLEATILDDYQQKLQENDYETVLGENYKLFIVEMSLFENSSIESFEVEDITISKEYALALLRSNTPLDSLAERVAAEKKTAKQAVLQQLNQNNITSDTILKDQIFAIFMANEFSEQKSIKNLIMNVKNSKMYVYPKKFLLGMIRLIPDKWIDNIVQIKEGEE